MQIELLETTRVPPPEEKKPRHLFLSYKERRFVEAYMTHLNNRRAYLEVYPHASVRTADVNGSRMWARIREKIAGGQYYDTFGLGPERLAGELNRKLRAQKTVTRKVVVFVPGKEAPEIHEETVDVDDNQVQLGALRILADLHGVGKVVLEDNRVAVGKVIVITGKGEEGEWQEKIRRAVSE